MRLRLFSSLVCLSSVLLSPIASAATDEPAFLRTEDVIYGRKYGTALTMDVFAPKQGANGAAVVFMTSGGWLSSREAIHPLVFTEFLKRGYTVFAVVHGSQPKFTIPEVLEDVHRAVRFIRYNADRYAIEPDRIGVTGSSAGGHLSLMIGTAGKPGDPDAKDPVDRASSRVQAVACFFPPTDFMNYGRAGRDVFVALHEELAAFKAPFDFQKLDPETKQLVLIRDKGRRRQIAREISPITHVTADDPPTLIIHGDADKLVPIQQAEIIIAKLKKAHVPAKLVARPGADHGWTGIFKDMTIFADWFDTYLGKSTPRTKPVQ
jgi:acetyl esterase/lipase